MAAAEGTGEVSQYRQRESGRKEEKRPNHPEPRRTDSAVAGSRGSPRPTPSRALSRDSADVDAMSFGGLAGGGQGGGGREAKLRGALIDSGRRQ